LFSVVVPIYNSEKHLKRCIESILNQAEAVELILVDDGSTDGSQDICNHFLYNNSNIIYHYQKNSGVSVARNTGIELATQEYIIFVDSDDYLDSEMFPNLSLSIKTNDFDMLIFGMRFSYYKKEYLEFSVEKKYPYEGNLEYNQLNNEFEEMFEANVFSSACNKVFKRSFILNCNIRFLPSMKTYEDLHFVLNVISEKGKIYFLNKSFYNYRLDLEMSKSNLRTNDDLSYLGHLGDMFEKINILLINEYKISLNRFNSIIYSLYSFSIFTNIVSDKYCYTDILEMVVDAKAKIKGCDIIDLNNLSNRNSKIIKYIRSVKVKRLIRFCKTLHYTGLFKARIKNQIKKILKFKYFQPLKRYIIKVKDGEITFKSTIYRAINPVRYSFYKVKYNATSLKLDRNLKNGIFKILISENKPQVVIKVPKLDNVFSIQFVLSIKKDDAFERYRSVLLNEHNDISMDKHSVKPVKIYRNGGYLSEFVKGLNLGQIDRDPAEFKHVSEEIIAAINEFIILLTEYYASDKFTLYGDWMLQNLIYNLEGKKIINVDLEGFYAYQGECLENNVVSLISNLEELKAKLA